MDQNLRHPLLTGPLSAISSCSPDENANAERKQTSTNEILQITSELLKVKLLLDSGPHNFVNWAIGSTLNPLIEGWRFELQNCCQCDYVGRIAPNGGSLLWFRVLSMTWKQLLISISALRLRLTSISYHQIQVLSGFLPIWIYFARPLRSQIRQQCSSMTESSIYWAYKKSLRAAGQ
jgi:hypothetical protein